MNNLYKYNIFVSKKVDKLINSLHPIIKNKFNMQVERRLKDKPNIPDNIHIRHIIYDLFELKIDNFRFYYFVFHRDVKVVDFYAEGVFNPFVEIMLSSTKDRQKETYPYIKRHYNEYYRKNIAKEKYKQI